MASPVEDALRKLRSGCRDLGRAGAALAFESLLSPALPDEATAGATPLGPPPAGIDESAERGGPCSAAAIACGRIA